MAQPLLEAGQYGFIVSRFEIDYPVRRQSRLGNGRGKEILPDDAP